jgi:putative inorganic carbon (hco3(-)) transporter
VAFPLFLLLNFILFLRPEDLFPEIQGLRLYYGVFILCILAAFGRLSQELKPERLLSEPITCCILLYGLVFTISNFINLGTYTARTQGIDYFKQFLYYLLLVAVIDTPERLKTFLKTLVLLILMVTCLVLLDHHEIVRFMSIEPIWQNEYDVDGAIIDSYPRLRYLGFFEDPNDLSMILGVGILLAYYLMSTGRTILRVLWLMPLGLFAYLIGLTQSRGGLLGLAAAIAAYFASRLGWKKALPLALVAMAGLLFVVGGRQANFSLSSGTGQARLQHWSDGLILMSTPRSFLFGIGFGMYEEEVGHVAHNSYIQAFVETGMLGGILFAGMFLLGFGMVYRQQSLWFSYYLPLLARMQPFLLAVLADYLVCMYSLSRNYVVPTYLMLGLMTVFLRLSLTEYEQSRYRMGMRMLLIIVGLGLMVFVVLKLFLRSFVQFSGA